MTLRDREETGAGRWVMLQAPGWNVATVGALLMIAVHLSLWALYRNGEQILVGQIYHEWGGLSRDELVSGKIWQLITHSWLHVSVMHLGINVLLFYYAAARLSHFLSGYRIMGLFFLSGVLSGLAHVLAQFAFPALPGLVGSSGGLTGLLLGFFAVSPDSRMFFFHISAGNLSKGILIASAFLFLVSPALDLPVVSNLGRILEMGFGPALFQAAHLVHFVGGLTGWCLISKFLPRLLSHEDLARMRLENESRIQAG